MILTADAASRQHVATTHVAGLRRAFTLRQFARLCEVVTLDSRHRETLGSDLATGANRARQLVQPRLAAGADDIQDPFGQDIKHFRTCLEAITGAIDDLMRPVEAAPAFSIREFEA